jgi:serine phosphatase RsbU (regulator of sigma subunit)/CHASE3 domain sensor protein
MGGRWGLRARVFTSAAAIAVVAVVTFVVVLAAIESERDAADASRAAAQTLADAGALERLAVDLETGVRGYVLTGERDFLAPYTRARAQLPQTGARLAAQSLTPAQARRVVALRAALYSYAAGYLAMVVRLVEERAPAARAVSTTRAGKTRLDALRVQFDRFTAAEVGIAADRRRQADDAATRALVVTAAGLLALLGLLAVVSLGAVRVIVGPVRRLAGFASELRAGNLATRLPETGPAETAELARAFNATAVALERAEGELRAVSERHLAELDAVFRGAPLALAFVDVRGDVMRVNEAVTAIAGRAAGELVGRPVADALPASAEAVARVLATGEPVLDVEIHPEPWLTLLASYFPVRGEDGELIAVGVAASDVTARRSAEAARERLQEAIAALGAAVGLGEVTEAVVEQAAGALGACCALLLLHDRDEGELRPAAAAGADAPPAGFEAPVTEATRSRRPVFAADAGTAAVAALPLIASGDVIGVLAIGFPRPMAFDPAERDLLEALAAQSAQALARAELYEREHAVAQTLQASLLPRVLPHIPGLDLAARLEAGAPGLDVGGDFYDAFALAPDAWGMVIGDVCGKGVEAAALTALARHTVRAAARSEPSPAAVLEALNRAALAESGPGQFLTAVYAHLVARPGGGFAMALACGGHPPPVVLDAALAPRTLACAGTLLGAIAEPEIVDAELVLEPGDTMLLYTDGLTEAGAPTQMLRTEDVADLLAAARGATAAQTAERCLDRALAGAGGVARDDVAVLVAQVAPCAPALAARSTGGRTTAGESSTPGQ